MNQDKIDSLVEAHQMWLLQFRALIADENSVGRLNHDYIEGHTQCELGHLLKTGQMDFPSTLIANLVSDIHASFHDVARLLVDLHNRNASKTEKQDYLQMMEQLSAQLTELLQQAIPR